MKITIVSDGIRTQVRNSETGEKIEGVRKVRFRHCFDGLPIAEIEVICAAADIVTPADVVKAPLSPDASGLADTTNLHHSGYREFR